MLYIFFSYIFLGQYENAASVLYRRSDVETLKFAAELAQRSGNTELHKAIMIRHNAFVEANSKKSDKITNRSEEHTEVEENEKLIELPDKVDLFLSDKKNDTLNDSAIKVEGSEYSNESDISLKNLVIPETKIVKVELEHPQISDENYSQLSKQPISESVDIELKYSVVKELPTECLNGADATLENEKTYVNDVGCDESSNISNGILILEDRKADC